MELKLFWKSVSCHRLTICVIPLTVIMFGELSWLRALQLPSHFLESLGYIEKFQLLFFPLHLVVGESRGSLIVCDEDTLL